MEEADGAAADRAHPTSAGCHLSPGGGRGGDGGTVEVEPEGGRREMRGRGEGRCKREQVHRI